MIKDLRSLKKFFQEKVKRPIFGVGVYAFNRLGPEEFIPQYQLLALRYSLDTQLIEKDIPTLSLEKGRGIYHLNILRNSTSVLAHPKTQAYLRKYKNPLIIPYRSSQKMMEVARKNNWIIAANPPHFGKEFLENKMKFREVLRKIGVAVIPGEKANLKTIDYQQSVKKYGLPFFIQHPLSGGGKGNFLIRNKDDFQKALLGLKELIERTGQEQFTVEKFVKGSSPSLTGCVTRSGILSTSLQYQILSMPELYRKSNSFGLFCGHDWTASNFDQSVEKQADDIVERVGRYFQKLGYKGIFGLDFILDEKTNRLYVSECNPRLLGSFPTITMAQLLNGEPPILAFHILEFLGADYQLDLALVNQAMRRRRKGTQMLLHNLEGRWAKTTQEVQSGIYRLENGEMKFLRQGYKLSHLKSDDEFLITEGVPIKGSYFSSHRRLVRILSLRSVLAGHLRGGRRDSSEVKWNELSVWEKKW